MRRWIDLLALVGIFAGLALFVAYGPGRAEALPGARATSFASGEGGSLALYRWVEQLGYPARRLAYGPFALEPGDGLLFVLGPSERYDEAAVAAVVGWVEAGGTLVVADTQAGRQGRADPLLRALGLEIVASAGPIWQAPALHPALGSPPVGALPARTAAALRAAGGDLAPLAGTADEPVVGGLRRGAGYIIVSSALHPFTNAGLREAGAPALALNLLRWLPAGERVVFDEIHHGFVSAPSLRTLLLGSPLGWALIYGLAVGGAYLALGGRRFGRPVPLRAEVARRSSAEYIESMAGMLRRAGQRPFAAEHYRAALRRRLGQPHGLGPALDDEAFVRALAAARPLDADGLRRLLAALRRPDIGEAELVRLVAEADRFS